MRVLRRIAREQRGAMAVTVGLLFPALLGFGVLAVDVGNWYVHKRELQTQADAAALAGAAYFKYPCDNAPISAAAHSYAGKDHNVFSNVPAARSTALLNRANFSGQSKPGDSDLTGSACDDAALDVKMTEKNVPWIFGKLFTPFINAQSRVSVRRLEQLNGLLPIGVPVPDPKRVRVAFISEVTGEVLGHRDLCKRTDPENGLQIWDNASSNTGGWNAAKGACDAATPPAPLPQAFDDPKDARVGVRVQVSGSASTIDCGQSLVTCYDEGSSNGAGFVHGWSDQPEVTDAGNAAPQPRSAFLLPGTCGDAYFSAKSTTCTVGLRAKLDFQPREYDAAGNPRKSGGSDVIGVKAVVTNASGGSSSYDLAWDTVAKSWRTDAINVSSGAGALDVKLEWTQRADRIGSSTCTGNKPCTGATAVVQRTFSASDARSGPIQLLQIGDVSSTSGVADIQRCSAAHPSCTTNFVVRVGIGGALELSKPGDPPTTLRVNGANQTQAIDCDKAIPKLEDEIAQGCTPNYHRNTGQACTGNEPSGPQPLYCVRADTGQSASKIGKGLNLRILGNLKPQVCSAPNRWPNYDPSDPRIISTFVVPYGSFKGTGNDSYPVQDFAFFYITGWTGNAGFDNPCQGKGDDPVPGNDDGVIVGHFIKYIRTVNDGGGGETPCDLSGSSISGCVAVMTR